MLCVCVCGGGWVCKCYIDNVMYYSRIQHTHFTIYVSHVHVSGKKKKIPLARREAAAARDRLRSMSEWAPHPQASQPLNFKKSAVVYLISKYRYPSYLMYNIQYVSCTYPPIEKIDMLRLMISSGAHPFASSGPLLWVENGGNGETKFRRTTGRGKSIRAEIK